MRKFLLFLLFVPAVASAQLQRFDSFASTTASASGIGNLLQAVPTATVLVYNYPGVGINCSGGGCTAATTFTSSTGGTSCAIATPLTRPTSSTCFAGVDIVGNFGFWVQAGSYQYCISATILATQCYNIFTGISGASNNTFSGNNTFTGTNFFANINNTQMCDQFSGATADLKIQACIAALPSTGGIADARGLTGSQTIASEIDVGGPAGTPTKFVDLLLPCGANWSVTITGGTTSAIKVFGASSVVSLMCAQNGGFKMNLAAAGNVASLVTNDQTCAACSIKLHGMLLGNGLGGTVANAMLDLSNLGNQAEISSINVSTFKTKGLWVHGANSESTFTAINVDGVFTTGNVPCTIETTSSALETMRFFGLDCQHPGAGNNVLVINGHGLNNLATLSFYGSHFEGSNTDTTTPFVSVADAKNIAFYSPLFNSLDAGSTNWGVTISQTVGNLTDGITVVNATHGNGNYINDTIRSHTISGTGILNFYQYGAANSQTSQAYINGIAVAEGTTPTVTSLTGSDVCYGDSTAHAIKCNYNNSSYFNQTQTIGTGNVTTAGTAINTLTCQAQTGITITGAATTDNVVANIGATLPATWQTGIVLSAHVTASNTVTVYLCNPTATATITPAATQVNVRVTR